MSTEWFGILASILLGLAGLWLGARKQPAEVRSLDSSALKNAMEANDMFSDQILELQKRIGTLEKASHGPFRLTVEFSTGESPKVHKAELIVIK